MASNTLVIGKAAIHLEFSVSRNILDKNIIETDATDLKRTFSGLASEISFGISLLGSKATLISLVGKNFDTQFREFLEKSSIQCKMFYDSERETAVIYRIHIPEERSITLIQNNSYQFLAEKNLFSALSRSELDFFTAAFVGTGIVEADTKFIFELNNLEKKIPIIFSLDGNVLQLVKWRLEQLFDKISILVCTEEELIQIETITKQSREEILGKYKQLKYILSAYNREKIVILSSESKTKISDAPAEEIINESLWYTAFRAGLTFGISMKKPVIDAAKIGSAIASYAVEKYDYNKMSPSLEQVMLRAFEVKSVQKSL